mmetsp:Transcript_30322/g.97907  ORF Transcript_30322/g.97907 Transcript_30322/m.97907 type:complete len:362 (-) Transcript_30322:150-1235(-)
MAPGHRSTCNAGGGARGADLSQPHGHGATRSRGGADFERGQGQLARCLHPPSSLDEELALGSLQHLDAGRRHPLEQRLAREGVLELQEGHVLEQHHGRAHRQLALSPETGLDQLRRRERLCGPELVHVLERHAVLACPNHLVQNIGRRRVAVHQPRVHVACLERAVVPLLDEHAVQQRAHGELLAQVELAGEPRGRGEVLAVNEALQQLGKIKRVMKRPTHDELARKPQAAGGRQRLLDLSDPLGRQRPRAVQAVELVLFPLAQRPGGRDHDHFGNGVEDTQPHLPVLWVVEDNLDVVRVGRDRTLQLRWLRRARRDLLLQRRHVAVPKVHVEHPPADLELLVADRSGRLNIGVERDQGAR